MRKMLPLFCLFCLCLPGVCAGAGEELAVVYPERPPYNTTEGGKAGGIWVELTRHILEEAGLRPSFTEMPSRRILEEISRPDCTLCSFGWFKTPERESYARFSLPFYRDPPLVAVLLAKNAGLTRGVTSLDQLAALRGCVLGLVAGWSYGAEADRILARRKPEVMEAPSSQQQALMLAKERFTYTLIRQAEIGAFARSAGLEERDLYVVELDDLREQSPRHIICGRGVPPALMERIDAAIIKLVPEAQAP